MLKIRAFEIRLDWNKFVFLVNMSKMDDESVHVNYIANVYVEQDKDVLEGNVGKVAGNFEKINKLIDANSREISVNNLFV